MNGIAKQTVPDAPEIRSMDYHNDFNKGVLKNALHLLLVSHSDGSANSREGFEYAIVQISADLKPLATNALVVAKMQLLWRSSPRTQPKFCSKK